MKQANGKRGPASLAVAACLILCTVRTGTGELFLGASVWNQSPDGKLVRVNGGIGCDVGKVLGWWYEWGDGTASEGFFPAYHRYEKPGTYLIEVKGFDDLGNSQKVSFLHTMPNSRPRTTVREVRLSQYAVGMQPEKTAQVTILAYDQKGDPISLPGHSIETFVVEPESVYATADGSSLSVSVDPNIDWPHWMSYVYVYVDKIEADTPLSVIVNTNVADYLSVTGAYTATYLPQQFFRGRSITSQEYVRIVDWAYQLQNWTVRDVRREPGRMLDGITYEPRVYGANCCPICIGDAAVMQEGIPNVAVIFHEMGHNTGQYATVLNNIGAPGAFYYETISAWYVQFVLRGILSQYASDITPAVRAALTALQEDGIEYHKNGYLAYLDRGCPFEYEPTRNGSHPLVHLIYGYCGTDRWDRIRAFLDHFRHGHVPDYARIFAAYGGIAPVENRVTMMAAALSSTFALDVRPDFARLNFPINEPLYQELMELFVPSDLASDYGVGF